MDEWQLKTPVAFLIFNRPEVTRRVFLEIARAKPPKLLIVADGPRVSKQGEAEKCKEVRKIIESVNWECEVLTNYSEINLGCKVRISSGLDWVFEKVPEAIILEDDCLPEPTFFRFCEELLERYRDDKRIGMISGDNFQLGCKRGEYSYYFSRYSHIWGWATWRRAWKNYDCNVSNWPIIRNEKWLNALFNNKNEQRYWLNAIQTIYDGKFDTWDIQWNLACWTQGMVSITPNTNLVSNIGFGADATHTNSDSIYSQLPTEPLAFPLSHPKIFLPHREADAFTALAMFSNSLKRRVLRKVKTLFSLNG